MKNYFKLFCFAGSLTLLTFVASCSKDDDDDNMTTTPVVEEETDAVTFASTIKPIIENSCAPCHTGGDGTDYRVYENAKGNVDGIINRTERSPGDAGFMPVNGEALSAETIAQIKAWKEAEFPE